MVNDNLILYYDFNQNDVFKNIAQIIDVYENDRDNLFKYESMFYECLRELIDIQAEQGFAGNLWHSYLTLLLVNSENAYSLSCEINGNCGESLLEIALHDLKIIKELYDYPLGQIGDAFGAGVLAHIGDFKTTRDRGRSFNKKIREQLLALSGALAGARSVEEFKGLVEGFYKKYGVGSLGLHKAFRIEETDGKARIVPITNVAQVSLDDLIGYETAKKKLVDNTMAFIKGRPANNCLLYGDAGTGKSSSIKAIMNEYYDDGLRIIEVYKHQFKYINSIISQIKNRNYRFIIYMDDLSFEEFEIEYKYLKAVIEGGLEVKPSNILIYATSNRRHLIRETFRDKTDRDEELHTNDTVQEKLSLANRFGVQIFYGRPEPKEFKEIVKALAERNGINMAEDDLLLEANRWELSHGGLSGRTAQQFIDYLLGKEE